MTIREAAERVLFGRTLEEKLQLSPLDLADEARGKAILLPEGPGRPDELRISEKGVRVDFPSTHHLEDDRERGVMLHFLGNHELLAAELMALVLLRFPDAPTEYRKGVYEAMREEQMHTLMYLRRMRECGIQFGELPLNDYFWRIVAPMETPMDFVTRLNLTFEQANLDFSRHYAGLFRQAGDAATAGVLEKIYQDEIGHVGHGVKWFRHWKERGYTDWEAYQKKLIFPLSPIRAKGLAPFNAEGRRQAGLDEDFIHQLEICSQSRGRTPVVHWLNPNAEGHAMSAASGVPYQPDKTALALQRDLAVLPMAWARRDDVVIVPELPDAEHLTGLQRSGLLLPEFVLAGELDRKLGGLRPWAWTRDASEQMKPLAGMISPQLEWQWREDTPALWFSKELGIQLEAALQVDHEIGVICRDEVSAWSAVQALMPERQALAKAAYSCAGRGHKRINTESPEIQTRNWLKNTIAQHGCIIIEPWLERVLDFSALYEMSRDGCVELVGLTLMENDAAGRFLGTHISPKWGSMLPPEIAAYLFKEARVMEWYQEKIPTRLAALLPGYVGPIGVDALVHRRTDGRLCLRPVVEVNVRMTMGRVAWELHQKLSPNRPGAFRILRKDRPLGAPDGITRIHLNDPAKAEKFLAVWENA